MGDRDDRYKDIDRNIAANLRAYREARSISQEELAQRMADRGFGFSQATVWKIESGQRPVRASELMALADSLGSVPCRRTLPASLTRPGTRSSWTRPTANASRAYCAVKEAAAAYLEAQVELVGRGPRGPRRWPYRDRAAHLLAHQPAGRGGHRGAGRSRP